MPRTNPAERRVRYRIGAEVVARPDARVAKLAACQWGVVSLAELRSSGLTRRAAAARARSGRLHRVHRGVYAVGHASLPLEGRFLAAVKSCPPGAVLSHFSAASFWGLVEWDGRRLEVLIAGAGTRGHQELRVHRTEALVPEDRCREHGIPVTSPTRTLVDLAGIVGYRQLRRALRQAQSLRLLSLDQLLATMIRLGPRRGTRNLKRIIAAGHAPTRSALEDNVLDLILGAGLERPDVNLPLMVGGRRLVPDFRWPGQRLVVEADGAAWHDHKLARESDAERQALLEAHGERVVRVTWEQVVARPAEVLARLRAAGAPSRRID